MPARQQGALIIDDDEDIVQSLRMVLQEAGLSVMSAANGEAGIASARKVRPQLIILDILMPRQDGLTTYEQLRGDGELAGIPVIVLTSVTEKLGIGLSEEDLETRYGVAPAAFLRKPIEPAAFLRTVRSVLRLPG